MDEDDMTTGLSKGPTGMIRLVIFLTVAVILVSTIAVPMIANAGEYSKNIDNEGAKYTYVTDDYFKGVSKEFYNAENVRMVLNQDGFGLTGTKDGVAYTKIVLSVEDYETAYPIIVNGFENNTTAGMIYSYDDSTKKYTITSISATSTVDEVYVDYIIVGMTTYRMLVQDPHGALMISAGPVKVQNNENNTYGVLGFTIAVGKILYCTDGAQGAYLATKTGISDPVITTGTPLYNISEGDQWSTINSISYSGNICTWYLCAPYVTESDNYIDGTTISTLISIIPLLIIAGIIIYVVSRLNASDR